MTLDNDVHSVSYNGKELQVEGVLDDWEEGKTFSFSSCDDNNPGELVINGTDWNENDHCLKGGMMLMCTAENSTSPWHNFGSNLENWVDNEDNSTLCSNEGSGSMVSSGLRDQVGIILDLHGKGAKKIWSHKNVTSLKGTPKIGKQF